MKKVVIMAVLATLTVCAGMVFAQNQTVESRGEAPCTIGDGYQTVRFDNGASYSGNFKDCKPLSGPAVYIQGTEKITGYATPIKDNTVVLKFDGGEVTITVITRIGR
jgi:hypothetical protein